MQRWITSLGLLERRSVRYGIAVSATAAAFAARMLLTGLFGVRVAFILFYPAVMLAATLGGFWPGILATGLAVVLAEVWLLAPIGSFLVASPSDVVSLVVFALMGVFMSSVAALYHHARQRASDYERELALRESEQRIRRKLDSALSVEGGIGDLELGDVLDLQAIQSIMNSFYEIARIPMSMMDIKGDHLVGVGWQDICTKFHRVHPETCRHCLESDILLTAGIVPGEFKLYKCKNGMWDVATPIIVGGQHVGNLFSGQFFFDDEPVDYAPFVEQARQYGFDEEEYISALRRVPRLNREALNEGMAFFIKLAALLSKLGYGNVKLAQSLAQQETLMASLRDSEDRQRMAIESADLGAWDYDPITGELNWSARCKAIFGLPSEAIVDYDTFLACIRSDDRLRTDEVVQTALDPNGDGSFEAEYTAVWPDGVERWISARGKAYFGEVDGRRTAVRFTGTVSDLTERKRAEERERELESHKREFYRRTILAATEGKLMMSDPEEIEKIAGMQLGAWRINNVDDVASARDGATVLARDAGMDDSRVYDLVGCVVESAANAAKHAGGGLASLYRRDDRLVFVVSDSGPGIGALRLPDVALTKGYTTAGTLGMGYKVMISVADKVYLATGPEGTTVASELKLHGNGKSPVLPCLAAWHY